MLNSFSTAHLLSSAMRGLKKNHNVECFTTFQNPDLQSWTSVNEDTRTRTNRTTSSPPPGVFKLNRLDCSQIVKHSKFKLQTPNSKVIIVPS